MNITKTITIKQLSAELNADYLDFFDNRAFTDGNPNGPCYCTSPNQDEEDIKQMVSEFKTYGVKDIVRKYAVNMLNENKIHGYLAYDGEFSIGWCNAADMESYVNFVPQFEQNNVLLIFNNISLYYFNKCSLKFKYSSLESNFL